MSILRSPDMRLVSMLLFAATMAACDSTAPHVGVMAIQTRTSGASMDADGYVVHLGWRQIRALAISADDEVSLPSSDYVVELGDVAANCAVLGTNPRVMEVVDGEISSTDFDVECSYVPRDMAFITDRDGHEDIYALGTDGSYPVRLTAGAAEERRPDWSPDGRRLAFMREGYLLVMDAGGSDPVSLAGRRELWIEEFEWSPDGTRVAHTLASWDDWWDDWGGEEVVWVVSADGGHSTELGDGYGVAWSPDGTRIAFSSRAAGQLYGDLHVTNVDGSNLVALTDYYAGDPAWSPDGTRISFTSAGDLHVMDLDGPDLVVLTDYGTMDAVWSPDGKRIALSGSRDMVA